MAKDQGMNPLDVLLAQGGEADYSDVYSYRYKGQLPTQARLGLYKPVRLVHEGGEFAWHAPAQQVSAEVMEDEVIVGDPRWVWN